MAILRPDDPYRLIVGMTGVKMGDRIVQIGCADGGRLAALAGQVGLSGRAVVAVPDESSAARARKAAAREGVLLEVEVSPLSRLPGDPGAFDIVVIDDTGGLLGTMAADERLATIQESLRVLRPGGRVMVIGSAPRAGLGALFARARVATSVDPTPLLQAGGCKAVRILAERDGLVFAEGMKPGS